MPTRLRSNKNYTAASTTNNATKRLKKANSSKATTTTQANNENDFENVVKQMIEGGGGESIYTEEVEQIFEENFLSNFEQDVGLPVNDSTQIINSAVTVTMKKLR